MQVERVFGRGRGAAAAELPFSARAKRALEHALRESLAAEDDIITPRHLLLGLAADPSSGAARVLADFDVDKHSLRLAMERFRGPDETGIVGDFILPRFPAEGSDQILVEIPPHVDAPRSTIPLVVAIVLAAAAFPLGLLAGFVIWA